MRAFLSFIFLPMLCVVLCVNVLADTTVSDFEAMDQKQQVAHLTALTNNSLDKIEAKNPILALKIQEYFIIPQPGEECGVGVMALERQIAEYNRYDPQGYTIENAFAKVLSDYLNKNPPTTGPTTQPAKAAAASQPQNLASAK